MAAGLGGGGGDGEGEEGFLFDCGGHFDGWLWFGDIVGGVVMMRCSSFKVRMRDGNLGGRCFFVWLVVASWWRTELSK